jgi:hypothetical protein
MNTKVAARLAKARPGPLPDLSAEARGLEVRGQGRRRIEPEHPKRRTPSWHVGFSVVGLSLLASIILESCLYCLFYSCFVA